MTIEVGIPNNKKSERKSSKIADSTVTNYSPPDIADYRSSIREIMDQEFKNMLVEEIRNGVQEIMRTQRLAIGIIKEDFKQIISEVLEEKRQSIIGNLKKPDSP